MGSISREIVFPESFRHKRYVGADVGTNRKGKQVKRDLLLDAYLEILDANTGYSFTNQELKAHTEKWSNDELLEAYKTISKGHMLALPLELFN